MYGTFKSEVGEAVVEMLRPIQEEYQRLRADEGYLNEIFAKGAVNASAVAQKTLDDVYRKVGFALPL